MIVRYTGQKIYPFYQTHDGVDGGRRVFLQFETYGGEAIGDKIELVHRGNGLFLSDENNLIKFPPRTDVVLGRYTITLADGATRDGGVVPGLDVFFWDERPRDYTFVGKMSQRLFIQGENPALIVVPGSFGFNCFITRANNNQPVNLLNYERIVARFCSTDAPIEVPLVPDTNSSNGFIRVNVTAEQSRFIDIATKHFFVVLFVGDDEISVPFLNSVNFTSGNC